MPLTTIIVITLIILAFGLFGAVLAWDDYKSASANDRMHQRATIYASRCKAQTQFLQIHQPCANRSPTFLPCKLSCLKSHADGASPHTWSMNCNYGTGTAVLMASIGRNTPVDRSQPQRQAWRRPFRSAIPRCPTETIPQTTTGS